MSIEEREASSSGHSEWSSDQNEKCLKSILNQPGEFPCVDFLTIKVLQCSTPIQYVNKQGENNSMVKVVVADCSAYATLLVYDPAKFPVFKENETVILQDFIKKNDSSIIATQKTAVFITSDLKIPTEIQTNALTIKNKEVNILTAATSPQKEHFDVKGKVVTIGKLTTKRKKTTKEEIPFKQLKLKDKTSKVKVALWRDMATSPIKKGNHIMLRNFFKTTTYDEKTKGQIPVLSNMTEKSSLEFLQPFDDISSSDDDIDEYDNTVVGQVMGVNNIHHYRCCINEKCTKKKLNTNYTCSSCRVEYTESSAGHAVVAKLLLKTDKNMSVYTLFTDTFKEFMQSKGIVLPLSDTGPVVQALKGILPTSVKYEARGDKILKITGI